MEKILLFQYLFDYNNYTYRIYQNAPLFFYTEYIYGFHQSFMKIEGFFYTYKTMVLMSLFIYILWDDYPPRNEWESKVSISSIVKKILYTPLEYGRDVYYGPKTFIYHDNKSTYW